MPTIWCLIIHSYITHNYFVYLWNTPPSALNLNVIDLDNTSVLWTKTYAEIEEVHVYWIMTFPPTLTLGFDGGENVYPLFTLCTFMAVTVISKMSIYDLWYNIFRLLPFGAGRRVCVGQAMAKNRLFPFAVTLLQRFTFKPETSETKLPCDPTKFKLGIVIHPDPYKIRAIPTNDDSNSTSSDMHYV